MDMRLLFLVLVTSGLSFAQQQCGCGEENVGKRIIGGNEVSPHRYPWVVALVSPRDPFQGQFCAGTLISDRHVLTAGHCVEGSTERDVHVVLGAHRLSQVSPSTTAPVARILRHDQYTPGPELNDMALLTLSRPVVFSDKVRPACLPTANMTRLSNYFVVGWGSLHPSRHKASDPLMEVPVPEIDIKACQRTWSDVNASRQICGGKKGQSSCRGDSGGPLLSRVNGRVYHTGIVSFGPEVCANGDAAVYTRVAGYVDWITRKTKDGKFCTQ